MARTNGFIGFCLFLAIIGLIVLGFYSRGLQQVVDDSRAIVATLTSERDGLKTKLTEEQKKSAEGAAALQQAQGQIGELQKQLDEVSRPRSKSRTK